MTASSQPDGRLLKTIAEVLGVNPATLSDESSPETVPTWDSLNHLNIVMAIEGEFGVTLSADDALAMLNVGLIRGILATHGVEA